jgi:hypothetical protein
MPYCICGATYCQCVRIWCHHYISVHIISYHYISLHIITYHYISLHIIEYHWISLHIIIYISLNIIACHCIPLHIIADVHHSIIPLQHRWAKTRPWGSHPGGRYLIVPLPPLLGFLRNPTAFGDGALMDSLADPWCDRPRIRHGSAPISHSTQHDPLFQNWPRKLLPLQWHRLRL